MFYRGYNNMTTRSERPMKSLKDIKLYIVEFTVEKFVTSPHYYINKKKLAHIRAVNILKYS